MLILTLFDVVPLEEIHTHDSSTSAEPATRSDYAVTVVRDSGVKECNTGCSGNNPQQKSVKGKQQVAPFDDETTASGLDTSQPPHNFSPPSGNMPGSSTMDDERTIGTTANLETTSVAYLEMHPKTPGVMITGDEMDHQITAQVKKLWDEKEEVLRQASAELERLRGVIEEQNEKLKEYENMLLPAENTPDTVIMGVPQTEELAEGATTNLQLEASATQPSEDVMDGSKSEESLELKTKELHNSKNLQQKIRVKYEADREKAKFEVLVLQTVVHVLVISSVLCALLNMLIMPYTNTPNKARNMYLRGYGQLLLL